MSIFLWIAFCTTFVLIFVRKMNFFHLIDRRFKYIKHLSKSEMALLTYSDSIAYHYYNNQHSAIPPTSSYLSHLQYSYNHHTIPNYTSTYTFTFKILLLYFNNQKHLSIFNILFFFICFPLQAYYP